MCKSCEMRVMDLGTIPPQYDQTDTKKVQNSNINNIYKIIYKDVLLMTGILIIIHIESYKLFRDICAQRSVITYLLR